MKRYSLITLVFISQFIFTSCEKKQSNIITSQSADEKLKISIQAERYTSLDPWLVSIVLYDKDNTIATAKQEIQAEEISERNVNFTWSNTSSCTIKFTQTDGSQIKVPVTVEYVSN